MKEITKIVEKRSKIYLKVNKDDEINKLKIDNANLIKIIENLFKFYQIKKHFFLIFEHLNKQQSSSNGLHDSRYNNYIVTTVQIFALK